MSVAIIDYGSGNLRSATKAFEWAMNDLGLSDKVILTSDPDTVSNADRIVLPGVGAFADCKAGLDAVSGMTEAVIDVVERNGRPFLGICVGTQLMASRGMEKASKGTPGFGWIDGDVVEITPDDPMLKVPQIGWNTLTEATQHPVLEDIPVGPDGWHAYFVHSYHIAAQNTDHVIAETDYGGPVTAIVGHDNLVGTQFHPEKSQKLGLTLIKNFIRWSP